MAGHSAPFEELAAFPRGAFAPSAWDSLQRGFDIALIALTAPLLAPILMAAVALKLLFDGRPVLFRHVRLGRGGQPFVLYKIRTTPLDFQPRPDDWSDEDFPPRTRVGRWLRRFDLDELPQLYNVLKGDMSLVGPRPEMPLHAERFGWRLPEYAQRLTVRPGLSGLAQVRGWRGDTSIHQRLRCDLEYSSNRGPGMYFAILARTVGVEMRRAVGAD
jgi:lipopolysaccharide/colanic/teichoic acid biosynthesis glycosyltransferase